MTQPTSRPRPWTAIGAGAAAVGACAVCCAGPLLAFFGGLSVVSLAGAIWIPALAMVAVAGLAGTVWILRRRKAGTGHAAAGMDTSGPVDLGMPAARPNDRANTAGPLS